MPRQVRIQYPGAIYHVMARGDRREAIFVGDADRKIFLKTLGEACARSGFVVHAYVLMGNHYHLLIETPEANLSQGMGWLQNAFTRRINVMHGKWGHLFDGRYKAILTEAGNGFWALMDYIHLNPVRAGLVRKGGRLEEFQWSSLPAYLGPARERPPWLETRKGFEVVGVKDRAAGRLEFLKVLESRVDWRQPGTAGVKFTDRREGAWLDVWAAIRRGWMIGSDEFREKLLGVIGKMRKEKAMKSSNGYHGPELHEHGEARAEEIFRRGLRRFRVRERDLGGMAKGDRRKALIAAMIQRETTVGLDWITNRLKMGTRAGCCRLIRRAKEEWSAELPKIGKE